MHHFLHSFRQALFKINLYIISVEIIRFLKDMPTLTTMTAQCGGRWQGNAGTGRLRSILVGRDSTLRTFQYHFHWLITCTHKYVWGFNITTLSVGAQQTVTLLTVDTHTQSRTHCLSLSHTRAHTHSLTHTHCLSHTHSRARTLTHIVSLSHTHTHCLSHTRSHTLSLSHTHSL